MRTGRIREWAVLAVLAVGVGVPLVGIIIAIARWVSPASAVTVALVLFLVVVTYVAWAPEDRTGPWLPRISPRKRAARRQARPVGQSSPPPRQPPVRPQPPPTGYMTNAQKQRYMEAARCSDCGATGFDLVTMAIGNEPGWYLGRCYRCGSQREF